MYFVQDICMCLVGRDIIRIHNDYNDRQLKNIDQVSMQEERYIVPDSASAIDIQRVC